MRALALQEGSVEAERHVTEARAAEGRQDWQAAERSYLEAIKLAPAWAEALVNLGVVYNREGKTDDAIRAFTRAAQIKPKLAGALFNLGLTLVRKGIYGEAITPLRRTLEIEPENDGARRSPGKNTPTTP